MQKVGFNVIYFEIITFITYVWRVMSGPKIFNADKVVIQQVINFKPTSIALDIKREDLLHNDVSGNKFRKLKYNIKEAIKTSHDSILTFGGAYSNHISATAAAGKICGIKTIGIIRGEELKENYSNNPTLNFAKSCGMEFIFVSRATYKLKKEETYLKKLKETYKNTFIIPEGGSNELAIKGCEEILNTDTNSYDYICCAVGTGGTIAGIINASLPHQEVLGFPALKGNFLEEKINHFTSKKNWKLITDYHFGGYAKVNETLINFINNFKNNHSISLDPIYTGKLLFGVLDLIEKDYFKPNSKILVIHTGGLQGIEGMNTVLKKKKLPLIQ